MSNKILFILLKNTISTKQVIEKLTKQLKKRESQLKDLEEKKADKPNESKEGQLVTQVNFVEMYRIIYW